MCTRPMVVPARQVTLVAVAAAVSLKARHSRREHHVCLRGLR